MPIYEYLCGKCNKIYEIWQKVDETPPDKCTDCGGPLHKFVSLSSFQLKGGGWYVDGYSTIRHNEMKKKDLEKKENTAAESKKKNDKQQTAKSNSI